MSDANSYAFPMGGIPEQSQLTTDTAVFTDAYAVIPAGVMRDIVTSYLPFWEGMRAWVLARPLSGFAETFSQLAVELKPGGGSDRPELDVGIECVVFVTSGELVVTFDGQDHTLNCGGYAFIPPGQSWSIWNRDPHAKATFQWVRKRYQAVEGLEAPKAFVAHEMDTQPLATDSRSLIWTTHRFVDPTDMRHDMHVNIVTIQPGGSIPFAETHVMEHGLYMLQGKAVYRLNRDWVEVEAGDFLWLRAFCPQACVASGDVPFKYLLYKDVNRHPSGGIGGL